jgi:hypothetical protein
MIERQSGLFLFGCFSSSLQTGRSSVPALSFNALPPGRKPVRSRRSFISSEPGNKNNFTRCGGILIARVKKTKGG